jgi:hypothetical protein
MNLDKLWVQDPVQKSPSVSLTILVVTFLLVAGATVLHMLGKVSHTSAVVELFYSAAALYFGRRMSINGKSFSSEKAEEIASKVEAK